MGTSDAFQVLKIARAAGECNLRTWKTSWLTVYHEMHEPSYDFLFIIFSKKIIKNQENATVTLLWTHNSEMASKLFQTAHMFYFNQSIVTLCQVNQLWIFRKTFIWSDKVFEHENHLSDDKFVIGSLQFTITWYKNRHAGEQTAHWDIQNKTT